MMVNDSHNDSRSCGAFTEASVNAHKGLEQSRRDDMEAGLPATSATFAQPLCHGSSGTGLHPPVLQSWSSTLAGSSGNDILLLGVIWGF